MTDDEIMLTAAMEYVERVREYAGKIRDQVEAGDRDADDEALARALESCARAIEGFASRYRTGNGSCGGEPPLQRPGSPPEPT